MRKKNIVTIGGGTGTYVSLSGLKKYVDTVSLTAVVTTADSGGSTGRLVDQFGYLPVGDVRMALAALARSDTEPNMLRELFLYRFERGEAGLKGHNLGNLLLVALADLSGSEAEAIQAASRILNVAGVVLPVTEQHITLVAEYENGTKVHGEANIDTHPKDAQTTPIVSVSLESNAPAYPPVLKAIREADIVVLGPGDLYTSIIPNLLVEGVSDALQKTEGRLVYVANLMTKCGQTDSMSVTDHVQAITKYIGRTPDTVLINNERFEEALLEKYRSEREFPVVDDYTGEAIRQPMLATTASQSSSDAVRRSLVRHHPHTIAEIIMSLL